MDPLWIRWFLLLKKHVIQLGRPRLPMTWSLLPKFNNICPHWTKPPHYPIKLGRTAAGRLDGRATAIRISTTTTDSNDIYEFVYWTWLLSSCFGFFDSFLHYAPFVSAPKYVPEDQTSRTYMYPLPSHSTLPDETPVSFAQLHLFQPSIAQFPHSFALSGSHSPYLRMCL